MTKDLNALMKQQAGPTYFMPMPVVQTMVEEVDSVHVAMIPPPYERFFRKVNAKGTFKKSFKILGLYLTISNCRVKKRITDGYTRKHGDNRRMFKIKQRVFQSGNGCCPLCGRKFDFREMELHHVLPLARFQDLIFDERNIMLLCHECHKEIHCNPYRNIRLMESKAAELDIDLNERYNKCV